MIQYEPNVTLMFDINTAYVQIAAAADLYVAKGNLDIWIYLKDCKLQFHCVELKRMSRYFIGHYRSQALVHGMTRKAWDKLGRKLALVYFQTK